MKPLEPWHLALDGTHLIEASAGTGKTYTIGTLVLRLVLEAGLTIDRILVVTFTRAATAELRDRIRRRIVGALAEQTAPNRVVGSMSSSAPSLGAGSRDDASDDPGVASDEASAGPGDGLARYLAARRAAGHGPSDAAALAAALRDFDTAPIFTIHSFCQRVLQEFAFESGTSFEATLADDDLALRREIVADYWALQTYSAPPVLVAHLIDTAKVTPATLDRLAAALSGARGLDVLPTAADVAATDVGARDACWLDRAITSWHSACAQARDAFAAGRYDAEALLATSPALTRASLKKNTVPRWLDQIGEWLASDAPPPAGSILATLRRFTSDGIQPYVKDGCAPPTHPVIDALDRLAAADDELTAGLAAWSQRIRVGLAPYLTRETRLRRGRANAQAFDDLLHDLAAALDGDRGPRLAVRARARYAAALIDEFQDTDDVQYRIFRSLFGAGAHLPSPAEPEAAAESHGTDESNRADESNTPADLAGDAPATFLALIGDPKQAIYSFRGADVFAYLRAADDAGPERRWTLARNRRSDDGFVRTLNAVWSDKRLRQPFVYPGIRFQPVEAHHPDRLLAGPASGRPPAVLILHLSADDPSGETNAHGLLTRDWAKRTIPRRVAADIAGLLATPPLIPVAGDATRPLEPGDVAVLTRTNPQAAAVQRALGRLGIPSVRHGDASVFDTDEAAELARVLAAVIEPGAARLVRGALATCILGADAVRLAELAADETAWETEVERFRGWLERWQQAGFIQAYRRIVEEAEVAERLLARPDGERRLTNVQHVAELVHRAAHANGYGPRALLGWLARMRTDTAARTAEVGDSAQLRLERDTKAVQIVTVHRSKGLEYAVVYCPFLWYRNLHRDTTALRFTDPADHRPKLDIGAPPADAHLQAAEVDDYAEDARLTYVALTRAKHHCRIVWGPIAGAEHSALGRLCHPEPLDATGAVEETIAHVAQRLADPAAFEADLAALVACAATGGGTIAVRRLTAGSAPPWRPAPASDDPPIARRFDGEIPRCHRRTSYSALVGPSRGASYDPDAARDHDAGTGADGGGADGGGSDGGGIETAGHHPPATTPVARSANVDGPASTGSGTHVGEPTDALAPPAILPLDAFPAGADPGTCLHTVFERIDFTNPTLWPGVAADACRRAGLETAAADIVPAAFAAIVATRLGDGPTAFTLADVARSVRLNEMPFVLPVALGPGADARRPFTPADVAAALAADGGTGLPPGYAESVRRLGFEAVRGHLSGFIDMVCRVNDRWYIVDWKSNRLGSTWDDYAPAAIAGAMAHHHYYLQYHLYTVAVHRYLRQRVPGYRYADGFGGVLYLFVRGMHPSLGPTRGVFFDRPPEGRVAGMEAVLEGRWCGEGVGEGVGERVGVGERGGRDGKGPK